MGWTPLETIKALQTIHPNLKETPMTYAGRLDPMAEGVLIVLSGEDRFHRDTYLTYDKIYRATFLLGFCSDSLDILGKIKKGSLIKKQEKIFETLKNLEGTQRLPFPVYSSYKIQGKPLHWWAQQNRLQEITIPQKEMTVKNVREEKIETRDSEKILSEILHRIDLVKGNFRQEEMKNDWKKFLSSSEKRMTVSATFEVTSGTYIRSLAQKLGEELGCGALLFHLERLQVGYHKIIDSIRFQEKMNTPAASGRGIGYMATAEISVGVTERTLFLSLGFLCSL